MTLGRLVALAAGAIWFGSCCAPESRAQPAAGQVRRMLFDQGHGQRDPGELAAVATGAGVTLAASSDVISAEVLQETDILCLRGPTKAFGDDEISSILSFVRDGGALLLVMDEERRTSLGETRVNELITPLGLSFTEDTEYRHNCGGLARAGVICDADREIPFSGGRAVAGGTPFAFQLDEEGNPAQPFAAFKQLEGGGRIIVMGDAMAALLMGTSDGVRLSGVPRDPTRTTYWGQDSRRFMTEVFGWLAGTSADIQPDTTAMSRQQDVLAAIDLSQHIVAGDWEMSDGELRVTAGPHSRIVLPAQIADSYALTVEFSRTDGDNAVGVILPVGNRQCVLNLSVFDGEAHGIGLVDGGLARDNSTTIKPGTLETGHPYRLLIEVEVTGEIASISSQLDGRPLLQWVGNPASLSLLEFWKLPKTDCLGLIAYSDVTFHSVRVRPLDPSMRMTPKPTSR